MLVLTSSSGALTPGPGSSQSLWVLTESDTSPGLQILTLAHTSWEAGSVRPVGQLLSSNQKGARSLAFRLNMKQSMYKLL